MSLSTSNLFAALDTKKKKKSSSKSKDHDKKKSTKVASKADRSADLERAIFAQPQTAVTNWADDEDDDFLNDIAPLPEGWGEVRVDNVQVFSL